MVNRTICSIFAIMVLLCIIPCNAFSSVSPTDYGLKTAKTGVERYWALYNAHIEALKRDTEVDYTGISAIEIEIPNDAKSIPLGKATDFKGITIKAKNKAKEFYLFSLVNESKEITLNGDKIDRETFGDVGALKRGWRLFVVEDQTPWVGQRKGYGHAVYRKDALLIYKGVAQNKTVMPYGSSTVSKPKCRYAVVDNDVKSFADLTFRRTEDCTQKTYLIKVDYENQVLLKNLRIYTPANNTLYADKAIHVTNSTNIVFENIYIEGFYVIDGKWGYGVGMNNVWNFKCYRLSGSGSMFGNNNMSKSYLKGCDIDRYDIHCYGEDVTMEDCTFWGSGFSISSIYGDIVYKNCTFKESFPVGTRSEYSCNAPYNLRMTNCTYYMSQKINYVIYTGKTNYTDARRPELSKKCFPNVDINGLKIIPGKGVKKAYLFFVGYMDEDYEFEHIKTIRAKNIELPQGKFYVCTTPFKTKNYVACEVGVKGKKLLRGKNKIIKIKIEDL